MLDFHGHLHYADVQPHILQQPVLEALRDDCKCFLHCFDGLREWFRYSQDAQVPQPDKLDRVRCPGSSRVPWLGLWFFLPH